MSDIRIVRRRNRAHITGISNAGYLWITENMDTGDISVKCEISNELVPDMAESMRKDGLHVEIQ